MIDRIARCLPEGPRIVATAHFVEDQAGDEQIDGEAHDPGVEILGGIWLQAGLQNSRGGNLLSRPTAGSRLTTLAAR